MYKRFFHLERNPFDISPDPYFLFRTERHNEALASICHGVFHRKGFVVVTGEVGTGKTLLVRCLLEKLRKENVAFANVFNPGLSPLEFLEYVASDLGIKAGDSKSILLQQLNDYLIGRYRAGETTVLVVDEAQHLAPEVLEEIRLLTNLETSQQKLLQIVLVGQPELEERLDSWQLRQLKQRIMLRCRLEPLREEETQGYISRRLQCAGAMEPVNDIFPEDVMHAVHVHSKGIPRLINTISENALIAAYAQQTRSLTLEIISEVVADLSLGAGALAPEPRPTSAGDVQALARSLLQLLESLQKVGQLSQTLPGNSALSIKGGL